MLRPALVPFAGLCLASGVFAQGQERLADRLPAGARSAVFANTGLDRDDQGELLGVGPDYAVRFTAAEVRFTPALGKAAPHDLPLGYRLEAVGRGTASTAIGSVAPEWHDQTVRYHHGEVEATYELRAAGVKQNFVFTTLPRGDGDLIVRAGIDCALPAAAPGPHGIEFCQPGLGGVRIGSVLGIDGAGNQVQGSMRWNDGKLEFVLPDAFVDHAVLPLVLDPLLGAVVTLGGANDDLVPEVAYDASTDTYLVVWQRDLSLTNQDIRAQRLSAVGALVGGTLALESSTTVSASRPKVANVNQRNAFVVVWQQAGDIHGRGVASATGTLTSILAIATTTATESQPDLAGEDSDSADDEALCVWANGTTGDIEGNQITYTAAGTLTLGALVTFPNTLFSTWTNPCISQHGGGLGQHLLCWDSFGSLSSETNVRGCIVDRNLGIVVPAFTIASGSLDENNADCDGDGDAGHWVVAFEREEVAGGDTDVYAVPVHLAGTSGVVGTEVAIDSGVGDDERDPAVCWLQDACLVAWADEAAVGNYDTYVTSISPLRCGTCEGRFTLDTTTTATSNFPAMAWRYQANNVDNNEAMIVWQAFDIAGSTGDVGTVRFGAVDGYTRPIALGCGSGGKLAAKCPRAGNTAFRFELRGGAPSTTALLVLSPSRANLFCGPCQLVPDPWTGFVAAFVPTDAVGDTNQLLALPAGVGGIDLYAQWLGIGSLCFSGFDLSSAALVRLQ